MASGGEAGTRRFHLPPGHVEPLIDRFYRLR